MELELGVLVAMVHSSIAMSLWEQKRRQNPRYHPRCCHGECGSIPFHPNKDSMNLPPSNTSDHFQHPIQPS